MATALVDCSVWAVTMTSLYRGIVIHHPVHEHAFLQTRLFCRARLFLRCLTELALSLWIFDLFEDYFGAVALACRAESIDRQSRGVLWRSLFRGTQLDFQLTAIVTIHLDFENHDSLYNSYLRRKEAVVGTVERLTFRRQALKDNGAPFRLQQSQNIQNFSKLCW